MEQAEQLSTFERTLAGYENGFKVFHIATSGLSVCALQETANDVFQHFPAFDQLPVQDGEKIIGVIERKNYEETRTVKDVMIPLNDDLLVSADEPLLTFLPLLAKPPYFRLVLHGVRVRSIVTRSDAMKLPVRLLGFALVTNLELIMKDIIISKHPDDESWLELLSAGRAARCLKSGINSAHHIWTLC